MPKSCCDNNYSMDFIDDEDCYPYQIFECRDCGTRYSVERTPDFKNKTKI